jgi:hypothetical protein
MKHRSVLLAVWFMVFLFSVAGCATNRGAMKEDNVKRGTSGNKGYVGGSGSSTPEGKKNPGMCPLGCGGNTF